MFPFFFFREFAYFSPSRAPAALLGLASRFGFGRQGLGAVYIIGVAQWPRARGPLLNGFARSLQCPTLSLGFHLFQVNKLIP